MQDENAARIMLRETLSLQRTISRWRLARVCPTASRDARLHRGHYFASHFGGWAKGECLAKLMWDMFHHERYLASTCRCITVFWVPGAMDDYDNETFMPHKPGAVVIGTWEYAGIEDPVFLNVPIDGRKQLVRRGIMVQKEGYALLARAPRCS